MIPNLFKRSTMSLWVVQIIGSLMLIALTIFLVIKEMYSLTIIASLTIVFLLISLVLTIRRYIWFKNNNDIKAGYIESVDYYRVYTIKIKCKDKVYTATCSGFISSKIKYQVGRTCMFVVDKNDKAYIKTINWYNNVILSWKVFTFLFLIFWFCKSQ